jgi:hypothetical protein
MKELRPRISEKMEIVKCKEEIQLIEDFLDNFGIKHVKRASGPESSPESSNS